jgi:NAD(P)-dependent dehydrogenase (short-subunit alcohol dehydrogenase family)
MSRERRFHRGRHLLAAAALRIDRVLLEKGVVALNLQGQCAIVTGGAAGLGYSVSETLARCGAAVTICDIDHGVERIAADFSETGLQVQGIVADVSQPREVLRVVEAVLSQARRIDLLINNAGVFRFTPLTDEWEKALDDFEYMIGTNLRGVWLFGRAVAPVMASQGAGHIVNIATDHIHTCGWPDAASHANAASCSWAEKRRPPPALAGFDLYDASKWALNGLTQCWAKELRPHGVRVNSLCMGSTDTPMLRALFGFDDDNPAPADLLEQWLRPDEISTVLIELIAEGPQGRSGDNVGFWVDHPVVLPPPSPLLNVPATL